jgi:hypothetical protein
MSKMQLLALTHAKKHPVSNGKLGQPSSTSKKLKRPASHQPKLAAQPLVATTTSMDIAPLSLN